MAYKVDFLASAAKDLRAITSSQIPQILAKVAALGETPRPPNVRKLVGSDESYRVRVGDYRIIYRVADGEQSVLIQRIRHRRDAYRK